MSWSLFDFIHEKLLIPEDRARFLLSTFSCIPLGYVLRKLLFYSDRLSCAYITLVGLSFSFFCFGMNALHIVALVTICYGLFFFCPSSNIGWVSLLVSFAYLFYCQVYRMIYDYSNYTLDVSGAIMMLVQKTTSAAYEYQDECSQNWKNNKVKPPPPKFFHYISYCLFYPAIFTGPTFKLSYFVETVTCYQKRNLFARKSDINYLGPMVKKFFFACLFLLINHYGLVFLPQNSITNAGYQSDYSFIGYALRVYFIALITRFQYYGGIALGESLCNSSFFGFNFIDGDSNNQNWDYLISMKPWSFETGTNLKTCVDSWNIFTANWLRFVVYTRVTRYRVLATFMFSALWHGFYPGFYFTFFAGAIATLLSRKLRYKLRPYFIKNKYSHGFYNIITWFTTQCFLNFYMISFIYYDIFDIFFVWRKLYYSGMIMLLLGGLLVTVLPNHKSLEKVKSQ